MRRRRMAGAPSGPVADAPPPRPWRPTPLVAASVVLHGAGLAVAALRPGRRRAIAGLVFADHLLLAAASLAPRSALLGPNLRRLPASAGPAVGLTFDDGPDPRVTPAVLDLLERRGARASFFCVGRRVAERPALVAEIARRGHRVENHSFSHPAGFCCYPPHALAREIDRTQATIAEATGRAPRFFRPPAGLANPALEPLLARRGLTLASWTRRGYDTVRRDPEAILARLVRDLRAGDVLLLHDRSGRGRRAPVLDVLPRLLERLGEQGLAAVPL